MNESRTCASGGSELTQARSAFDHDTAKALYRALHRMPKPARQFAHNIIQIIEGGALNAPRMGNHPLQDPKRLLRVQLERFEKAMKPLRAAGG